MVTIAKLPLGYEIKSKVVLFFMGLVNEQAYRFIFCMFVTAMGFIGMFSHRIDDTNCIPIIALIVGHYLGKSGNNSASAG